MVPDSIPPKLAWSFSEPIPASPQQLVEQLDAYARMLDRTLDRSELDQVFPGDKLDVNYYDSWQFSLWRTPKVIRIAAMGEQLTYADILFRLHRRLHLELKDRDHRYFEGLYLLDRQHDPGVPVYEMYLGS